MADFKSLRGALAAGAAEAHEIFIDTIEEPGRKLGAELGGGTKKP